MPEYTEIFAHYLLATHLINQALKRGEGLTVLALWANATKQEQLSSTAPRLAREGHVHQLDGHCSYLRGGGQTQRPLYSPMLGIRPNSPPPLSICVLKLQGSIQTTNQTLVLDFGSLLLFMCIPSGCL